MPSVISLSDAYDIQDRYLEHGWLNQGDQDRRENSIWVSCHKPRDIRIPGRELTEWFDDFYASIDRSLPDRKIPKPKPYVPKLKPKPKIKYPSEKDLTEDEEVFVWSDPILPITPVMPIRSALEYFKTRCRDHLLRLQFKTDDPEVCRIWCTTCFHSIQILESLRVVHGYMIPLLKELQGQILDDNSFVFETWETIVI